MSTKGRAQSQLRAKRDGVPGRQSRMPRMPGMPATKVKGRQEFRLWCSYALTFHMALRTICSQRSKIPCSPEDQKLLLAPKTPDTLYFLSFPVLPPLPAGRACQFSPFPASHAALHACLKCIHGKAYRQPLSASFFRPSVEFSTCGISGMLVSLARRLQCARRAPRARRQQTVS